MDEKTLAQTIGAKITELREARGWTKQALADKSGVARRQIFNLETGEHHPNIDTLEKVLKAFNMTLVIVPDDDTTKNLAQQIANLIASK